MCMDSAKTRATSIIFFFNDTATTEIYTLSLHDALPICLLRRRRRQHLELLRHERARHHGQRPGGARQHRGPLQRARAPDRKSTRLNSSHANNSHAVFCLKKNILTSFMEKRSSLLERSKI